MGLERLAALLQGKHDNYDTDLFQSLIAASVDLTGVPAEGESRASHRVIADHLRATSFLIADGVLPSNEGRGYVLRRIMRRAMRHAHLLGAKDPVLHRLVPALIREMGEAYPELGRARALISETLELEENRFKKMLDRGLGLLDDASKGLGEGDTFDGDVAFKLYDTYGFPLDLTQDALRSRSISVDTEAFDAAMERQRADARAAWAGSGDTGTDTVWFAVRDAHGASEFLGYDTLVAEGVVVAAVKDGAEVQVLQPGEEGAVVVNQTPFYAESGGQQGDQGTIKQGDATFTVRDTVKRADGVFAHLGTVSGAPLKVGEPADLSVDGHRRQAIRSNHSATHLLHEALRETLGDHVAQKGSLVAPDRLRFDFSHPKPIETDELAKIEDISNAVILQDSPVETRLMDVDSAIESGARALFGEKYGDEVRVVSMGDKPDGSTFSVELCGGTHVNRTGEIGLVRVVSEGAVAAGVRRVEALTGEAARSYLSQQDTRVKAIAGRLKVTPDQALERVDALMEERRKLEREVAELKKQVALGGGGQQARRKKTSAASLFPGVCSMALARRT
jgi:alanyl-tRNA synthetase